MQPDENIPTVLFPPEHFVKIALLAFLGDEPVEICETEHIYAEPVLMDSQIIECIQDKTQHIDPLQWPSRYELNDDLVLELKDLGRIWVPPDEELHQEVVAAHHDGKIAGHLGTTGTLELVGQKYWWDNIIDFV